MLKTTATVSGFHLPFRHTSFARQSFSTAAPLTWNSLPPALLKCNSTLSLLSNPDIKLICFLLLSFNCSTYLFCQHLCSCVTALWHFMLLLYLYVIIIIIMFVCWLQVRWAPKHSSCLIKQLSSSKFFHLDLTENTMHTISMVLLAKTVLFIAFRK